MKKLLERAVFTVGLFVFAALGAQLALPATQVTAAESQQPATEQPVQPEQESETESQQPEAEQPDAQPQPEAEAAPEEEVAQPAPSGSYQYVAQNGDTYSQMARKAIQTYGIVNDVNLSQAQIMMAETNMTIEAGSPILQTGQAVEITNAAVEKWVAQAEDISEAAEAAWQEYARYADFNTNNIGE